MIAREASPAARRRSGSAASARIASPAATGSFAGTSAPFTPVLEEVVRGADPVGDDEREPAGSRLVDDDAPGLVPREEREDVRDREPLGDPLPWDVREEREPHAETLRQGRSGSRSAPEPARTRTRRGSPAAATARTSVSSPFSGARRAIESTATSSGAETGLGAELVSAGAEPVRLGGERRRRRSCRQRARSAPGRRRARASTRGRVSRRREPRPRRGGSWARPPPSRRDASPAARRARSTPRAARRGRRATGTTPRRPGTRTCSSPRSTTTSGFDPASAPNDARARSGTRGGARGTGPGTRRPSRKTARWCGSIVHARRWTVLPAYSTVRSSSGRRAIRSSIAVRNGVGSGMTIVRRTGSSRVAPSQVAAAARSSRARAPPPEAPEASGRQSRVEPERRADERRPLAVRCDCAGERPCGRTPPFVAAVRRLEGVHELRQRLGGLRAGARVERAPRRRHATRARSAGRRAAGQAPRSAGERPAAGSRAAALPAAPTPVRRACGRGRAPRGRCLRQQRREAAPRGRSPRSRRRSCRTAGRARRGHVDRGAPSSGRTATRRVPPSARPRGPVASGAPFPETASARSIIPVPTTAACGLASMRARSRPSQLGQGDVVGVHPRDVAAARGVEPDVQRAGEPERLGVPHHAEPVVADRREHLGGSVGRAVVDDDELEIAHGLAEHAPNRLLDGPRGVAGGEDDRHERRGHGGLRVACAGARRPSASTSSSRRSTAPTTSPRCSTRSTARRIAASGVVVVDQNDDDRVARAARGSSVGRDAASPLAARAVARAQRRARRLSRRISSRSRTTTASTRPTCSSASRGASREDAGLGGLSGRAHGRGRRDGRALARRRAGRSGSDTVWHTANSHTIFLRREVVDAGRRLRRGARARQRDAVVVGRGDRLPRPRAPHGRADRVRPGARDHPSGQGGDAGRARRRSAAATAGASATSSRGTGIRRAPSPGCSSGRPSARSSRSRCSTRRARDSTPRRCRGRLARPSRGEALRS